MVYWFKVTAIRPLHCNQIKLHLSNASWNSFFSLCPRKNQNNAILEKSAQKINLHSILLTEWFLQDSQNQFRSIPPFFTHSRPMDPTKWVASPIFSFSFLFSHLDSLPWPTAPSLNHRTPPDPPHLPYLQDSCSSIDGGCEWLARRPLDRRPSRGASWELQGDYGRHRSRIELQYPLIFHTPRAMIDDWATVSPGQLCTACTRVFNNPPFFSLRYWINSLTTVSLSELRRGVDSPDRFTQSVRDEATDHRERPPVVPVNRRHRYCTGEEEGYGRYTTSGTTVSLQYKESDPSSL